MLEKQYPEGNVIPVVYHYDPPFKAAGFSTTIYTAASQRGDTSTTPGGSWLWVAIDGRYPRLHTPGRLDVAPGRRAGAQRAYDHVRRVVEERLQKPAEARIDLSARRNGDVIQVSVSIDSLRADGSGKRLQVILLENEIRKVGQEGIRVQPNVVRYIVGDSASGFGMPLAAERRQTRSYSIDLRKVASGLGRANEQGENPWA